MVEREKLRIAVHEIQVLCKINMQYITLYFSETYIMCTYDLEDAITMPAGQFQDAITMTTDLIQDAITMPAGQFQDTLTMTTDLNQDTTDLI